MTDDNAADQGKRSDTLIILISELFRESDAEAMCEVSGLWSNVSLNMDVDISAGLAGLASAGEEIAELQSLLAIEMALLSNIESVVKSGPVVMKDGDKNVAKEEGAETELLSSSTAWLSSMNESSELDMVIGSNLRTAFGP